MEVSKIVPQFFYDVIARGVPGGALLIGWSFALGSTTDVNDIVMTGIEGDPASITSTVVFLVLFAFYAYVLGHIISPVGEWISKSDLVNNRYSDFLHVLRNCVDPEKSTLPKNIQQYIKQELDIDEGNESDNFEYTSILFIWSDWLRFKSADAGSRIVKLRAEYRMLIGLSVVGAVTSGLHIVSWIFIKDVKLDLLVILLGPLVFYLGLIGYCRAYKTFQWGVINSYYAEKIIESEMR